MISKAKIKELISLMDGTDIGEIEITSEKDKDKIRISRLHHSGNAIPQSFPAGGNFISNPVLQSPALPEPSENDAAEEEAVTNRIFVKAPLVGTFYESPKPEDPAFINVGDVIRVGQTVCIIEAMKIFNEIESEVAGKVVEILASNEDPVEYGQPLMVIEPV